MFWLLPLAGAALGAMTSKDPLKGALMGAAVGATGGAAAGGLLGAGAAGAAGAGATTAAGAASGAASGGAGLLGNMGAAASYGTSLGSQQTAMLAAQEAGMGGLTGGLQTAASYAKPAMQGMQMAQQAGLLGGEQEQMPQAQARQNQPLDLSNILQGNQQAMQMSDEESKRRQQELEQYAMNMMGGYRG